MRTDRSTAMSLTTSRTTCLLVSLLITSSSLTQAAPLLTKLQDPSPVSVLVSPRSTVGSLSNAAEDGSATPGATAAASSTPDAKVNKGNNVGAIVGGTIATGIILVMIVFVWFAIRRQCLIERGKKGKRVQKSTTTTEASSSSGTIPQKKKHHEKKESVKKTTSISSQPPAPTPSHRPSPICTQGGGDKDADPRSELPSPLSSPASSTAAQVGVSGWHGPTVPSKAAHFLGLYERGVLRPPHGASQSSAPPAVSPPASFDLPLQGTTPPQRRSSGCTMSTLGMELLRDVMQSPDVERFNTPPPADQPWQPSHSRQPSRNQIPTEDANGRCPSPIWLLPELSPTSPDLNQGAFQSMGPARKSADVQRPPRVVRRDTVRKDRFSMGSNKF